MWLQEGRNYTLCERMLNNYDFYQLGQPVWREIFFQHQPMLGEIHPSILDDWKQDKETSFWQKTCRRLFSLSHWYYVTLFDLLLLWINYTFPIWVRQNARIFNDMCISIVCCLYRVAGHIHEKLHWKLSTNYLHILFSTLPDHLFRTGTQPVGIYGVSVDCFDAKMCDFLVW